MKRLERFGGASPAAWSGGGRQQLAISCSTAQKTAIQEAAKKEGLTTAEYVLKRCGVLFVPARQLEFWDSLRSGEWLF